MNADLGTSGVTGIGGPNNPIIYPAPSAGGQLVILNPSLKVKKEVCIQYDGLIPTCENDKSEGWLIDDSYGNVPGERDTTGQPTSGVTDGEPAGVEQGLIPSGATMIQWRITALNDGNTPLTGVHVAADAETFQPSNGGAVSETNVDSCTGMKFGATYVNGDPNIQGLHTFFDSMGTTVENGILMPNDSLTQTCTTVLEEPFSGIVQNSVALNALFDDGDDPVYPSPASVSFITDPASPNYGYVQLNPATGLPAYNPSGALMWRFNGYGGYDVDGKKVAGGEYDALGEEAWGQVPSNIDSAQVSILQPRIKLTKWVCEKYDDFKKPTCQVPPDGSDTIKWMSGVGTQGEDGTFTPVEGQQPNQKLGTPLDGGLYDGWVKAAFVPYEADATWLLIVTNIGNTAVTQMDFNTEYVAGKEESTDNWVHVPVHDPDWIMPGHSATYTVNTHAIIDTGTPGNYKTNGTYDPKDEVCVTYPGALTGTNEEHCTVYADFGERIWEPGTDVVNTAIATAVPSDDKGVPLKDSSGKEMVPVFSNPSIAEAYTFTPSAALKVTKWVCSIGTGCPYDWGSVEANHAILQKLTGVHVDPGHTDEKAGMLIVEQSPMTSDPNPRVSSPDDRNKYVDGYLPGPDGVVGANPGPDQVLGTADDISDDVYWQWLPETTVGYGSTADWLIVVTNIGDTSVARVVVSDMTQGNVNPFRGPLEVEADPFAGTAGLDETTSDRKNPGTRVLASGDSIGYQAILQKVGNRGTTESGFNPGADTVAPWNEMDRNSGSDSVVNIVDASAYAWDVVNDTYLANPNDSSPAGVRWTVPSNTSSAEVRSIALAIGDWVWYDSNEDGIQADVSSGHYDDIVSGVKDVQVDLLYGDPARDGTPVMGTDGKPMTTTTDEKGFYYFDMLTPGTYRVAFHLPTGWMWTPPWSTTTAQGETLTNSVSVTRDSNAAYPYSVVNGVPVIDPQPASDQSDQNESVRVSAPIDMNVSTLLDYEKFDHLYKTEDSPIPDLYKDRIRADFINPTIDAGIIYQNPAIMITKWICTQYEFNAVTGKDEPACVDPNTDDEVLRDLAGFDGEAHDEFPGVPAGGWDKEAMVPYGADALWVMVVTNTGRTVLANVTLEETLANTAADEAAGHGATGPTDPDVLDVLDPRESFAFMLTTQNITNKNETVPGFDETLDYDRGEPIYYLGDDTVINSAFAVGEAQDYDEHGDLQPMYIQGTEELLKATSNISAAEANTVDFAIGDYVWIDSNMDGLLDTNEKAIDTTVTLYRIAEDGTAVNTGKTVDTVDGYYLFDNLPAGTYQVQFERPQGYLWTTPLVTGDNNTIDYPGRDSDANPVTGRSGNIVLGLDKDGVGLGRLVEKDKAGLDYSVEATWVNPTVDAGLYPADTGIKVTKWVCTTTSPCADPAGDDLTAMAGYDTDNGVYPGEGALGWGKETTVADEKTPVSWLIIVTNTGESKLSNVTVDDSYSTDGGAGALTCDPNVSTNAAGEWVLGELAPGASKLLHCTTASVSATAPYVTGLAKDEQGEEIGPDDIFGEPVYAVGDDVVNGAQAKGMPINDEGQPIPVRVDKDGDPLPLESNVSEAEVNVPGYAVGDFVWIDSTPNGKQDSGETGLAGVEVFLYKDGVRVPGSATTDKDGYYYFDGLSSGSYQVEFVLPSGYLWTQSGQGDSTIDSDAIFGDRGNTATTARSAPFTLGSTAPNVGLTSANATAVAHNIEATYLNPTLDAGLVQMAPKIDLAKYVCATGTGCTTPINATTLNAPSTQWVKSTVVEYGTNAEWLVLVQNTGNVPLMNVQLTQEAVTAAGGGFTMGDCTKATVSPYLAVGEVAAWRCMCTNVTNITEDVVNTAQAQGTPTRAAKTDANPEPAGPAVLTDPDAATVTTEAYAVGDYVWFDANNNGKQDADNPDETGVAGVPVKLYKGDTLVDTKVTDADGYYYFDLLGPGEYRVEFGLSDGYVWTQPGRAAADLDSNAILDQSTTQATASSAPFTLGKDADNVRPIGEATSPVKDSVQATYINETIDAGFAPMTPKIDLAKYVCARGTGCTTPTNATTLNAPSTDWVKSAVVRYDTNAEWLVLVQNTGNVPLMNVVLTQEDVTAATGGFNVGDCTSKNKSVSGYLAVGEVAAWTCTSTNVTNFEEDVVNTAKAEGTPTRAARDDTTPDPAGPSVPTEPDSAQVKTEAFAVGDYVWLDTNGDGLQNTNENGVADVTVYLYKDGAQIDSTTTDENGFYYFDMLNPGDYQVTFVLPDGYLWTAPGASNVLVNSDALLDRGNTQARASSAVFTVGRDAAQVVPIAQAPDAVAHDVQAQYINPSIDAGVIVMAPAIDLAKYVCAMGTGCQVPATVTSLDAPNSTWVKSTTVTYNTSADWLILVKNTGNVPLGSVRLTQENVAAVGGGFDVSTCESNSKSVADYMDLGAVAAWRCSVTNVTNITTDIVNTAKAEGTPIRDNISREPTGDPVDTPQDTARVRTSAYAVGDYVWFDANGDGRQGPDEDGLAGATVKLLDADGNLVGETVTDADGYYFFDTLTPGDYQIEFTLPSGYVWTKAGEGTSTLDSDAYFEDNTQMTALSKVFTVGPDDKDMINTADAPEAYRADVVAAQINPTFDAGVALVAPKLELKKYVCAAGTGCTVPTTDAAWDDPGSEWVGSTTVPYGTSVEWLVIIKNTGNVDLLDINLAKEDFGAGGTGFSLNNCVIPPNAYKFPLKPGLWVTYDCTITNVTNTEALNSGKNVINTAQAVGTPVDKDGTPIAAPGKTPGPIYSNLGIAQVNATTTPVVDTGGVSQSRPQGWVIPLILFSTMMGVGVLIVRRRFS